jgi:DNA polymerase-1
MGQVPASKSPYGHECRSAFGPNGMKTEDGEEIVQVGADMSGLQLRALAHLLHPLDGGAYSEIVTSGDVHWSHTQAMGLVGPEEPRDKHSELHNILREKGAKTFGYSYLFGCFPPKSGRVVRDCLITARTRTRNGATCSTSSSSPEGNRYTATRKWARLSARASTRS